MGKHAYLTAALVLVKLNQPCNGFDEITLEKNKTLLFTRNTAEQLVHNQSKTAYTGTCHARLWQENSCTQGRRDSRTRSSHRGSVAQMVEHGNSKAVGSSPI